MAGKIIDELITLIGFKVAPGSEQSIKKINDGIKSIRRSALYASGALVGFGYAINRLASAADSSAKFADGIGVSYENLQKLEFAAQKAGASSQDLDSSLLSLTQTLTSLRPGEYNQTLAMLGISARDAKGQLKSADRLLLEIADKYKKLSLIRRQQFGAQQGFSPALVNFLGQGSQKIISDMREAARIGAVVPERLKKQSADLYSDSLLKLKSTIKATSTVITLSLVPSLIKVIDGIQQFIAINKEIINSGIGAFFSGMGEAISDIGSAIDSIIKPFIVLYKLFDQSVGSFSIVKAAGYGLTVMLAGLAAATLAATWEWIALGAAIVAVVKAVQAFKNIDFLNRKVDFSNYANLKMPFDFRRMIQGGAENIPGTTSDNSKVINNTNNFTINTTASGRDLVGLIKENLDVVSSFQVASPGYNRAKVG